MIMNVLRDCERSNHVYEKEKQQNSELIRIKRLKTFDSMRLRLASIRIKRLKTFFRSNNETERLLIIIIKLMRSRDRETAAFN